MSTEEVALNPPAGYGWGWVAVLVGSLVLLAALGWWTRRALRATSPHAREDTVVRLRRETLTVLDESLRAAAAGDLAARSAAGRMGADVRRFIGIVSDGDADFTTLPQLQRAARGDVRLGAVVAFVGWLEPHLFGTGEEFDVVEVHRRAVTVVEQWR